MWPDRVSNPGPPTYESDALPIALRGPAQNGIKKIKNPPAKQINQIQLKHKIDSTAWRIVWILVRLKFFFT